MGLSRKLLPVFVVAVWILLTLLAFPAAGRLSSVAGDPDTVELPRGAEATRVAALADRFPGHDTPDGVLVYSRATGLTAADQAKVAADRAALGPYAAGSVAPARTSPDGAAAAVGFALRPSADAGAVRDLARRGAPPGLTINFSGTAAAQLDASDASARVAKIAMLVTVLVVMVLLLVTYRSPVLWILPLVGTAVAYLLSDAVMYVLGRFFAVTVSTGNAAVVTVLVFGVGTDYAMLLLARYRDELRRFDDRRTAMAVALRGAVPAIAASAATVSLGLLCLLAADMGFNHTLGVAGAVAVLCAFVVLVTLLPALLVLLGRWVFWPVIPRPGQAVRHRLWDRIGTVVGHRPRLVWVGSVLVLAALAAGGLGMRTGLDDDHRFASTPSSVAGQQVLAAHFGTSPRPAVQVIVPAAQASAAAARLTGVTSVVRSTDGTLARLDVNAPLADVRAAAVPGARIGGPAAITAAVATAQAHDRRVVVPLVLAVVFVVLILLLRALVAPVLLMLTVLASYFAALGVGWFAFRHIFGFAAVDVQVKLIAFLFLVALGVDYTIFLVSRIRQESTTHGHRAGVLRALSVTGGVITSAGLVLAATFLVLLVTPYVAFAEIGFVIAAGVLIDTLLVRSLLVPALALDVGPRFWWPSAVRRRVVPGFTSEGGRADVGFGDESESADLRQREEAAS